MKSSNIGALLAVCCLTASLLGSEVPSMGGNLSDPVWATTGLIKPAVGELVDHELYYAWVEGVWSLSSRTTYGWDGESRPTTVLDQDWQGGVWVNNYLSTTTYDGTGAAQTLTQDWVGGQWVNDVLSTFENDGEQRPVVIVTQDWDGGGWVNQIRSTITYETGLQLAEMLIETWEMEAWVESALCVYTYSDGNVSELIFYFKDGEEWEPTIRSTYTYSGGKVTMTVSEIWFAIPPDAPDWVYSSRTTYTYEGDNLVEVLFESYSFVVPPLGWTVTGRRVQEYDAQGRRTVEVYQSYVEAALGWLNVEKTEYFYDSGEYLCGDADNSGDVNISDAIYLIQYIFASGPPPSPLLRADSDCSSDINMSDVIYLIQFIFASGPYPCDPSGDGTPDC
ncbi:MAG: dockerin type I repeat-containing protein [bacterium]